MKYLIAEKFKSIQGEGSFAGTPMAFVRFVGCSVGKKVCHACDTDFEKIYSWRGGGELDELELLNWAYPYSYICLTGGEPLDRDLTPFLVENLRYRYEQLHIETSGTKPLAELRAMEPYAGKLWICVSPKPGFLEESVLAADEVKVIVPGLGSGDGWPTLEDALRWSQLFKPVFLQPRNGRFDVDRQNLLYVQDLVKEYPMLRLSLQLHKLLRVQ
jgi:organic radical activating enzyme